MLFCSVWQCIKTFLENVVCYYGLMWWFGHSDKDIKRDNPQIWCHDLVPNELYNVLYTSNCIFASKDKDGITNSNTFSTNTFICLSYNKASFCFRVGELCKSDKHVLIFFNMNQIQNERIFFYNVQQWIVHNKTRNTFRSNRVQYWFLIYFKTSIYLACNVMSTAQLFTLLLRHPSGRQCVSVINFLSRS